MDPSVVFASLLGLSIALLTKGIYNYYWEPRIRRTEGVVVLNPDNVSTDKISFRPSRKT